ncbi:unnamed protein product [Thlaspi arvense]|uniref:Uncharacterized protein n=1 Tax=Thlaspi arvense TaxID=13288 RepID=A0AAU9S3R8_THLAR|nr:unnamed protein product [Thlaspi arvense]
MFITLEEMLLDPAKMRRNVETNATVVATERRNPIEKKKETTISPMDSVDEAMRPPPLELSKRTTTRKKSQKFTLKFPLVDIEAAHEESEGKEFNKKESEKEKIADWKSVAISSLTILAVIGLQKLFSALRPSVSPPKSPGNTVSLRRNRREILWSPPEIVGKYCAASVKVLIDFSSFLFLDHVFFSSLLRSLLLLFSSSSLLFVNGQTTTACILRQDYASLSHSIAELRHYAPGVPIIFVRTKLDLRDDKRFFTMLKLRAKLACAQSKSDSEKLVADLTNRVELLLQEILTLLQRAGEINKSLLTLGRVISALGRKSWTHSFQLNQKMMTSALIKDLYGEIERLKAEVYASRAMAELRFEQMGGQTENYQKLHKFLSDHLLEEMQGKYTGQARDCSDLTNRLDVTEPNEQDACFHHEELKKSQYAMKEKDFITSEQKKAGREDKLSADNRKVVDNYQQNAHLQGVNKLSQSRLEAHNKSLNFVTLFCKFACPGHSGFELQGIYLLSHLEAVQNVVRLHKPNSSACPRKFQHWRPRVQGSIDAFLDFFLVVFLLPGMDTAHRRYVMNFRMPSCFRRNGSLCRGIETGVIQDSTALKDAVSSNETFSDEHVSVFPMQAENDAREGADFSAAKHCRMELLLQQSRLCHTCMDHPGAFCHTPNSNCGSSDMRNVKSDLKIIARNRARLTVTQGAEREKGKKDYTREKGTESDIELTSVGSSWRSSFCKTFTGLCNFIRALAPNKPFEHFLWIHFK